jgi:hypothetical protein
MHLLRVITWRSLRACYVRNFSQSIATRFAHDVLRGSLQIISSIVVIQM